MLFPSTAVALRCRDFLLRCSRVGPPTGAHRQGLKGETPSVLDLMLPGPTSTGPGSRSTASVASAVLFEEAGRPLAAKFWQHTGEGISSRRAEFLLPLFLGGHLRVHRTPLQETEARKGVVKGPKRYQKLSPAQDRQQTSEDGPIVDQQVAGLPKHDGVEHPHFIEERFGRNLAATLATNAKKAIRRRIAGAVTASIDDAAETPAPETPLVIRQPDISPDMDVFLFPTGMSAIFNIHRTILHTLGCHKSVMFGYVAQ